MESEYTINPRNNLATTSLVLGIAPIFAVMVFFIMTYNRHVGVLGLEAFVITVGVTALCSISALITGAASLRQIKEQGGRGKNLAIAGITLGVLTIVTIFVPALVIMLAFMGVFGRISL
jgi:hypothetical protein